MITTLGEVKESYALEGITYTFEAKGWAKRTGNPYLVLKATGSSADEFGGDANPHLTIWGDKSQTIVSVEFTWSDTLHVQFHLKWKNTSANNIPSGDMRDAYYAEMYLIDFVRYAQIVAPGTKIQYAKVLNAVANEIAEEEGD